MTSETIAKSTGSNPVVIRNLLGSLKQAKIVKVKRGSGGTTLNLDPKEITMWRVCAAVDSDSLEKLIGLHPNPSQICPVGSRIHDLLKAPYEAIGNSVEEAMSHYTLADLLAEYRNSLNDESTQD
jgi:DNA-binding IscR family transcriptional regulator